jgi:hypothetical protein
MRLRRREEERSLDFDMDYKNLAREHGAPPGSANSFARETRLKKRTEQREG